MIANECAAIMDHLRAVRRMPYLATAMVVVITEANLDWVRAREIGSAIKNTVDAEERIAAGHGIPAQRVYIYSYDTSGQGRPGIWLDNATKEKYVNTMIQHFQYNNVALHDPFVGVADDIHELRSQFLGFRAMHLESKSALQRPRIAYSGKGSGSKDDRIMALLMGIYHGILFFQREETCRVFRLPRRVIKGPRDLVIPEVRVSERPGASSASAAAPHL